MANSIPTTMKAVDVKDGKGPASALFINDQVPVPKPTGSQALVKIHSFGLNRMDLVSALPQVFPSSLPLSIAGCCTSR